MKQHFLAMHLAAAAASVSMMLVPSAPRAADEQAPVKPFSVDCWIGAKFGNQPGELVRGWTCVSPRMPEIGTNAPLQAQIHPIPEAGEKDVATSGSATSGSIVSPSGHQPNLPR